jgi:hypothetical protein
VARRAGILRPERSSVPNARNWRDMSGYAVEPPDEHEVLLVPGRSNPDSARASGGARTSRSARASVPAPSRPTTRVYGATDDFTTDSSSPSAADDESAKFFIDREVPPIVSCSGSGRSTRQASYPEQLPEVVSITIVSARELDSTMSSSNGGDAASISVLPPMVEVNYAGTPYPTRYGRETRLRVSPCRSG